MSSEPHIFDTYFVIIGIVAPVSNLIITGIFFYGACFSRYRSAFGLIAFGGVLMLVSQLYWLTLQLRRSLGLVLLPREILLSIFPIQEVFQYIGLVITIIGDAMLVWQACRVSPREDT